MTPPKALAATRYPYLYLRGRVYYFRCMRPLANKQRAEIVFSLQTSDLGTAKLLLQWILSRMSHEFNGKIELSNQAVRNRLREIAREFFRDEVEEMNERLALQRDEKDFDPADMAKDSEEVLKTLRKALEQIPLPLHLRQQAKVKLDEAFEGASKDVELADYLAKLLGRGEAESWRLYIAKLRGHYGETVIMDEVFAGMDVDAIRPLPETDPTTGKLLLSSTPTATGSSLDAAIQDFLAYKSTKNGNAKSVKDIEHVLGMLRLVIPDVKSLSQLTKARVLDFETKIHALPASFTKIPALAGMSYTQLVEEGKKRPRFSPATYDKYCISLRGFVSWCQATERMVQMTLPKFVAADKESGKTKRHPFTKGELRALFDSPLYAGHRPDLPGQKRRHEAGDTVTRDWFYWVPLVGLYSGMRLGEIMQLHVTDIRSEDGVMYFDVNDDAKDKHLKTPQSRRKVPFHPELLRLGFDDYLHEQKGGDSFRVFSNAPVAANGSYGDPMSKIFGRYLKAVKIKHPKLTFHSLRHSFIDQAHKQAKLADNMLKDLVGHEESSVTFATYGSSYTLAQLREGISSIAFNLPDLAV